MAVRQIAPARRAGKSKSAFRKKYPSAETLRELLIYNPCTGELRWKRRPHRDWRDLRHNRHKAGRVAGTTQPGGYVFIGIDHAKQYRFLAHRIAWILWYGEDPTLEIDHINRIKNDNRITNLRTVDRSAQARNKGMYSNNTSGYAGVSLHKPSNKWRAAIGCGGRIRHIGYFDTPEEASAAYQREKVRRDGL